jgi:hypothetical protein
VLAAVSMLSSDFVKVVAPMTGPLIRHPRPVLHFAGRSDRSMFVVSHPLG